MTNYQHGLKTCSLASSIDSIVRTTGSATYVAGAIVDYDWRPTACRMRSVVLFLVGKIVTVPSSDCILVTTVLVINIIITSGNIISWSSTPAGGGCSGTRANAVLKLHIACYGSLYLPYRQNPTKYEIGWPCSGQEICRQRCQSHTTNLPKIVTLVKVLATIEQAGVKINTDVQGHMKMSFFGIQSLLIHCCFPDTTR